MNRESVVIGIAGVVFGLLVGWIIGSQARMPRTVEPAQPAPAPAAANQPPAPTARLDEAQIQSLRAAADASPKDPVPRRRLGDLYFDAERYQDAIGWYEAALAIEPGNPDVRTDLGVSYYYANEPDRALEQFAASLRIDPAHTKTLLNVGVVRASAKRDLAGAMEVWQQVLTLAPDSPEGRAARQLIETLKSDHGQGASGAPPATRGSA